MMPSPVGSRGSWFATWKGKSYPVLHNTWRKTLEVYHDPMVGAKLDGKKYREYINALSQTDAALLQKDAGNGDLSRVGYIGLFRIDEVAIHSDGAVSLKIVERIA